MKNILLLAVLTLSTLANAGIIKEKFPTVPVTDALGTKKVSVKNFCITEDGSTLIGVIGYCRKASNPSRGYKKCTSRARVSRIEIENHFTYTVRGPRDRVTEYSYSIDPVVEVKVIDWDARGSEELLYTYDYALPICD